MSKDLKMEIFASKEIVKPVTFHVYEFYTSELYENKFKLIRSAVWKIKNVNTCGVFEDGKYIYDLNENFMYMTGAYDVDINNRIRMLPINEEANPLSVNTINFRQVQIPSVATGAEIGIIYVPKPEKMTVDNMDAEIPLPANRLYNSLQ